MFMPQGKTIRTQELTQAQRAFVVTITEGLDAVDTAQDNLNKKLDVPTVGHDPVRVSMHGLMLFCTFNSVMKLG